MPTFDSDAAGRTPAHGVERLGPDGLAVHEVAVPGVLGTRRGSVGEAHRDQLGVGVEHAVHVADVAGAEGLMRAPRGRGSTGTGRRGARRRRCSGSTARGSWSRPHSSSLVSRFDACSQARCTPPSWATESSPYSKNTLVVELLGPFEADRGVDPSVAGHVEVADELVEEQPPQRLRATGCSGRTARPSPPRAG
jgi:hypothetical protein